MTWRAVLKESRQQLQQREIFVLVSWPEEEHDVSIISNVHHPIQGTIVVGEICNVAFGKRTFPAMVHATGSKEEMNQMMCNYLEGKHDLFGAKTSTDPPPSSEMDASLPTLPQVSVMTPLAPSSKINAPPSPLSTESSLPLFPSSGVTILDSPTAPPNKKKRKISDKENVGSGKQRKAAPKKTSLAKKKTSPAKKKTPLAKKGQKILFISPHGGVRPQTATQASDSTPAHNHSQPAPPPTNIQHTTSSAAHQPFQYSSAPNPPPTDIQYTTSPAAHHIVASETPVIPNNSHQDPLSLSHTYSNKALPSSSINKSELTCVDYVMKTNKAKSCKPSTLTQLLARDAFFGESLMAVCTPSGSKDLPALPKHEMFELKKAVFRAFPKYSPESFEIEWRRKCWTAIEQACGRLRRSR
jgi:hypothetical protein